MVEITLDGVTFTLREPHDFSWLAPYGHVFAVFDQQDSGNIAFGVENGAQRLFIKYAGAETINDRGTPAAAVQRLKDAMPAYEALRHPTLVQLVQHFETEHGYAAVFKWADGECLHAHWAFARVPKYTHPDSPTYKLRRLPLAKRLASLDAIFAFHEYVAARGYVAIDFYDGSILYDFATDTTTLCDIDLYAKSPYTNTMGRMWGSSRFMSSEEFELGAPIDEITNVFTMGATAFAILSELDRSREKWDAGDELYQVARKATSAERAARYAGISAFRAAWTQSAIELMKGAD